MVLILIFLSTDDRKGGGRSGGAGLDANLALETGNVERNLAKIFREKVKVFGTVQFTQVGIPAVFKFLLLEVPEHCCCAISIPHKSWSHFAGSYSRCHHWHWPQVPGGVYPAGGTGPCGSAAAAAGLPLPPAPPQKAHGRDRRHGTGLYSPLAASPESSS